MSQSLVKFFLSFEHDFMYFSDLYKKWLFTFNDIRLYDELPRIDKVCPSMVNFNYSLNFKVDRQALCQHINKNNGFLSRFYNAVGSAVTVECVYEPPKNSIVKKKANKIPHHTFLIYRTGSVTQSGPDVLLMEEPYYRFMETIAEIKDQIIYQN